MVSDIQQQLVTAYAPETDRVVHRAVSEGVLLADDHFKVIPFMDTLVGRDLWGHIRRAGVMYALKTYCDRGDLPFKAVYSPMPRGAWHWLEMRSENVLAHFCRTEANLAFPENTPNRQDARLSNQLDLFEKAVMLHPPQLYAWLMAGTTRDGALTHLCWGVPAAKNDEWLAYRNLLASLDTGTVGAPQPPTISPKDKLRFREHIQESIEKDKNERDDKSKSS